MKTLPLPSQDELRYMFFYNEKTGAFYARFNKKSRKIGKRGYINPRGYRSWQIDGHIYLEHRLIWMYVYGKDPGELQVDHKDRVASNNKIENLRLATHGQNQQNQTCKGVFWNKQSNKWQAQIRIDSKRIYLGYFEEEQDALDAYQEAKKRLHGEFAPSTTNTN